MRHLIAPRTLGLGFAALAGAVLVIAFLVICYKTGSLWPWNLVVHEDGVRTLVETILYYEHATRELPIDLLLGIAIGGSVAFAYPPGAASTRSSRGRIVALALATAAVIGVIVGGAVVQVGLSATVDNLLQLHSRPGAPLVWGAHWRYHLGSRLALILMSIGLAGLLRLVIDPGRAGGGRAGLLVCGVTLALWAALTILLAQSWLALQLVLQEPIPLGHQARELLTHALVTVPLGWAACLLVVRPIAGTASGSSGRPPRVSGGVVAALISGLIGTLLAAYVGIAALRTDAAAHGQTHDLAMLVFPHYFEHSFTYVLVALVAMLVYEAIAARAPG